MKKIILIIILLLLATTITALTITKQDTRIDSFNYNNTHCKAIAKITEVPKTVNKFQCFGNPHPEGKPATYDTRDKSIKIFNMNNIEFEEAIKYSFHEIKHHLQDLLLKNKFDTKYKRTIQHDDRLLEIEADNYAIEMMHNNVVMSKTRIYIWTHFYEGNLSYEEYYEGMMQK